jgi:hypothetical protein
MIASGGAFPRRRARDPQFMSRALRMWPLLTGVQRYEKIVSTRNRGHGQFIEAPILAYLIETSNGRILYDVGCDYAPRFSIPCGRSSSRRA